MRMAFDENLIANYNSASQKIRVLSESWVLKEIYCPSCGESIFEYKNNRPVADLIK